MIKKNNLLQHCSSHSQTVGGDNLVGNYFTVWLTSLDAAFCPAPYKQNESKKFVSILKSKNWNWYSELKYRYSEHKSNSPITGWFWRHDSHAKQRFIFHVTCYKPCYELSPSVFLHHFGLGSLWQTVDCDGDVRATEHLFQNLWHSIPAQPIQAAANAARDTGEEGAVEGETQGFGVAMLTSARTHTAAWTLWSLHPAGTVTSCPPGCVSGCRRSACSSLSFLWPAAKPRDEHLKCKRLAQKSTRKKVPTYQVVDKSLVPSQNGALPSEFLCLESNHKFSHIMQTKQQNSNWCGIIISRILRATRF